MEVRAFRMECRQSRSLQLDEKSPPRQLCSFISTESRLHGQVPRTLIDLNSSMSALACYRQLRIDSGLSVTRDINPAAQKLRIRVSLVDELTHYL